MKKKLLKKIVKKLGLILPKSKPLIVKKEIKKNNKNQNIINKKISTMQKKLFNYLKKEIGKER